MTNKKNVAFSFFISFSFSLSFFVPLSFVLSILFLFFYSLFPFFLSFHLILLLPPLSSFPSSWSPSFVIVIFFSPLFFIIFCSKRFFSFHFLLLLITFVIFPSSLPPSLLPFCLSSLHIILLLFLSHCCFSS